jgi:hypothetical protein
MKVLNLVYPAIFLLCRPKAACFEFFLRAILSFILLFKRKDVAKLISFGVLVYGLEL